MRASLFSGVRPFVVVAVALAACMGATLSLLPRVGLFPAAYAVALVAWLWAAIRASTIGPEHVFAVPWYCVAFLADCRLTSYQTHWSNTAEWSVLLGPTLLVGVSVIRTHERVSPRGWRAELNGDRALVASLVLLLIGVAGLVEKVRIIGGIPLFASNLDALRASAHGSVHGFVTFLADSAYLAAWIAIWGAQRAVVSSAQRRLLWSVAAVGIGLTTLNGSRNTLLFAVAVPAIMCFVTRDPRTPARRYVVLFCAALVFIAAAFIFRIDQHRDDTFGRYFYSGAVPTSTLSERGFYALYITGTYPFEIFNRESSYFTAARQGHGRYSAVGYSRYSFGLVGRHDLYQISTVLSRPFYSNVATYEGSLTADFGLPGVVVGSLVLGILLRIVVARFRRSPSDYGVFLYAYALYMTAFLLYENLLFFYPFQPWDLLVMGLVFRWVREQPERGPVPAMLGVRV